MGHVYKAIDRNIGKTVALKLVRPAAAGQGLARERFRRELALAQAVTHPNVCRVHDLGEVEGALYISMEFVEGQTLDDLIQSVGHLSAKQTVALGRQICAGLQAIHERGIVHRDLKPGNIMVDRSGRPILMDFGLAFHQGTDRLTGAGSVLGTLAYLSPEQARGRTTDHRSDLYGVGLILFEMLTGRHPPGDQSSVPLALREADERCPAPWSPTSPRPSTRSCCAASSASPSDGFLPPRTWRRRSGPPPPGCRRARPRRRAFARDPCHWRARRRRAA